LEYRFFQDVGCLLRVDDCTVDRDRFDYARVLLSTTSLDIIHSGAQVLIDGVLFDLQIIEEWGYSLGEDAFLLDDEESQDDASSGTSEEHVDVLGREDVDELLQHISESWKATDIEQQAKYSSPTKDVVTCCKEANIENIVGTGTVCAPSASVLPQEVLPPQHGVPSAPKVFSASSPASAQTHNPNRPKVVAGDRRGLSNSAIFEYG